MHTLTLTSGVGPPHSANGQAETARFFVGLHECNRSKYVRMKMMKPKMTHPCDWGYIAQILFDPQPSAYRTGNPDRLKFEAKTAQSMFFARQDHSHHSPVF